MEQHILQDEVRRIIIIDMVKKRNSIVVVNGEDTIVYKEEDVGGEIPFQEFFFCEFPADERVEEILMGNSDPHNPQFAQFGSKTMSYRGLGSGIPRVMAEDCDVELIDHPDGNQFIAPIWRTPQKDDDATQKANEELFTLPKRKKKLPKGHCRHP